MLVSVPTGACRRRAFVSYGGIVTLWAAFHMTVGLIQPTRDLHHAVGCAGRLPPAFQLPPAIRSQPPVPADV